MEVQPSPPFIMAEQMERMNNTGSVYCAVGVVNIVKCSQVFAIVKATPRDNSVFMENR